MSGHYMSFEATATLRSNSETFIHHIRKGERAPQTALLQRVLDEFISQCLDTYFIAPVEVAELSSWGKRIVVTAVATIRKTVQLVVGRIVRKLSNREMQPLADYMDGVLMRDRNNPQGIAYVSFPLDAEIVEQFLALQQHARAPALKDDSARLVASFQSIAEQAVDYFFEQPISMLRLGPVLSKVAQLGIDSSRSVINTMIAKLFAGMEQPQIIATLDYFCAMISDGVPQLQQKAGQYELA